MNIAVENGHLPVVLALLERGAEAASKVRSQLGSYLVATVVARAFVFLDKFELIDGMAFLLLREMTA